MIQLLVVGFAVSELVPGGSLQILQQEEQKTISELILPNEIPPDAVPLDFRTGAECFQIFGHIHMKALFSLLSAPKPKQSLHRPAYCCANVKGKLQTRKSDYRTIRKRVNQNI